MKPPDQKNKRSGARLLGLAAGVALLGAVIFYALTPLNVAARIGEFPGVGWLLHSYMTQWARNWSYGVEKPDFADLSDPALTQLGAGYFETGCAACHGAPGRDRNPMVAMMEPPPPPLASKVSNFSDRELYWIIWNGVRYTAMPGWTGEHREDEVWAMVAFLRNYDALEQKEYAQLAYGDTKPTGIDGGRMSFGGVEGRLQKTGENCARCHGRDGMGRDGTAPRIAGQSEEYLAATLEAYATGRRASGFMQPIAAPLSKAEITSLAAHYADMEVPHAHASASDDKIADTPNGKREDLRALGERLAAIGDPSRFVPRCSSCHEDSGAVSPRTIYPRIAGQESRFIEAWLRRYRDRPSGGTDFSNVMHFAAMGLTDHQIKALAAWYSSLPYDAGAAAAHAQPGEPGSSAASAE